MHTTKPDQQNNVTIQREKVSFYVQDRNSHYYELYQSYHRG